MPESEIGTIVNSASWERLGEDEASAYNDVFVSKQRLLINGLDCQWVLKKPKVKGDQYAAVMNVAERAVSKWNELNPQFPAYQVEGDWIIPYLGERRATDEQIRKKVIDIYLAKRRILIDGCRVSNFVVYEGDVICVDVDLSCRRGSIASDNYIKGFSNELPVFFKSSMQFAPLTAIAIQTLLYLERHLQPKMIKDDYVTIDMIERLYSFFKKETPLTPSRMDKLLALTRFDVNHVIPYRYLIHLVCYFDSIERPPMDGQSHIIHFAVQHGLVNLVQELIKHIPQLLRIKNEVGNTPMQLAQISNHQPIIQCFRAQQLRNPTIPTFFGVPPVQTDEEPTLIPSGFRQSFCTLL